jgi:6-phosphogluconolactonase/glucosamine-6-phosphate isomerase/deaminase
VSSADEDQNLLGVHHSPNSNCQSLFRDRREIPSKESRTRVKSLNQETIIANARFFGGDFSAVPKQALTVGVGTVMDAKEVLVLISGAHKAFALYKA